MRRANVGRKPKNCYGCGEKQGNIIWCEKYKWEIAIDFAKDGRLCDE